MIDDLTNEELTDPSKLRLVIKEMKGKIENLKKELKDINCTLTDDDKGLKILVHDLIDDVDTIDQKLNDILDSQKDTRKTVKNTVIGGGIGIVVTATITFVLKQLGIDI